MLRSRKMLRGRKILRSRKMLGSRKVLRSRKAGMSVYNTCVWARVWNACTFVHYNPICGCHGETGRLVDGEVAERIGVGGGKGNF